MVIVFFRRMISVEMCVFGKQKFICNSYSFGHFVCFFPCRSGRHANGTHVGASGVGSGQPVPAPINSWNNLPLERSKSKFASLSRLFKPWKWRVRRKSDKLESVSQSKSNPDPLFFLFLSSLLFFLFFLLLVLVCECE